MTEGGLTCFAAKSAKVRLPSLPPVHEQRSLDARRELTISQQELADISW
jgi:hypothetical protein